jgi:hypothetical protein
MPDASRIARALGRRGGRARAARLSAADRTRIASLGGQARLASMRAARRIEDNLRYAAAIDDLRHRPAVSRAQTAVKRLPGIYPRAS